MNLRRTLLLLPLAALLGGCASFAGPRDVEIPLAKMQAGLEKRFPINRRVLGLFEIALTRPQLTLLPASGRLALNLEASLGPSWRGRLGVSGRLLIDPSGNAVLLADPEVEQFALDGVSSDVQRQLATVAATLVQQVAAEVPLYHFKPEDLRYGGVQFVPTRLITTARGVIVSVAPAK